MKYKVFISGAQKELKLERIAAKKFITENVLLRDYFEIFLFEDLPAKSKSAEKVFLEEVSKCDIYVGLFADEYGASGSDNISATEKEYRLAKQQHKYILIFIKGRDEARRDKRLKALLVKVKHNQDGHCYERFETLTDLDNALFHSLVDFLKTERVIGKNVFDESPAKNATLADIDQDKVHWFLRVAKERRKFPLGLNSPVKNVLIHLKLLHGDKPTHAAVLLFGKNPSRSCQQAAIKCIQFFGTEVEKPFTSYQIYDGNIFEQIDKAVAFVLDAIKFPVIQQEYTVRVKRPYEIPVFAIQEAIVNAVAHRDYNNNAGVQVMVFADRVEIWNPGKLPDLLSVSDLRKPHTSYPHNPLIAVSLYLADYVQQAGSGTLEMIKQCRAQGLPEPEFVATRWEFRAILARDIFTEAFFKRANLNERQTRAVRLAKERGDISLSDLKVFYKGVADRTLNRDLQTLVDKKILKAYGDNKGRKYRI
jgi:predicted HTH transcriptional regulator